MKNQYKSLDRSHVSLLFQEVMPWHGVLRRTKIPLTTAERQVRGNVVWNKDPILKEFRVNPRGWMEINNPLSVRIALAQINLSKMEELPSDYASRYTMNQSKILMDFVSVELGLDPGTFNYSRRKLSTLRLRQRFKAGLRA